MKIKNDLISVKIGRKHYDFNNLILDTYLKKFILAQINNIPDDESLSLKLNCFMLKFDVPLENFKEDTLLYNSDFDLGFSCEGNYEQTITENQIILQYNYQNNGGGRVVEYATNHYFDNIPYYFYNRKITAIGFNINHQMNNLFPQLNYPICAILDTSNYNMYLQQNQDFSITRRDIITTDALFYSNNKKYVPGPAHLAPFGLPQIIYQPDIYSEIGGYYTYNDPGKGILYSIGLSSYVDYIDKEFIIGPDIQTENKGTELIIKGLDNYLRLDSPLFCNSAIYPNTTLYPVKTNYKYLIFKYKVWQLVHKGTYFNVEEVNTDTGYFYHQAIPIDKFGKTNIRLKYERG